VATTLRIILCVSGLVCALGAQTKYDLLPLLGNLDEGADADVAVLRVDRGSFGLVDSGGAKYTGKRLIVCEMTLRAGKVEWDLNGRASQDWRSVPDGKR